MKATAENTARIFTVTGMTCDHCVLSVTEEIADLAGVGTVDVDLASGRVAVTGADLDDEAIAAAVEAAGYEVVS